MACLMTVSGALGEMVLPVSFSGVVDWHQSPACMPSPQQEVWTPPQLLFSADMSSSECMHTPKQCIQVLLASFFQEPETQTCKAETSRMHEH